MSKSGMYINGKKVCDVTDNSDIELISKSISIQGGNASVVNSSNSRIVNSFNNQSDPCRQIRTPKLGRF